MRVDALLLAACAALAACGGAQRGDRRAQVRAPLGRMSRAADQFSDARPGAPAEAAQALRQLSRELDGARVELGGLRVADAKIRAPHASLIAALGEMGSALSGLADVLERRDESRREPARARLRAANERWAAAVEAVRGVCPAD